MSYVFAWVLLPGQTGEHKKYRMKLKTFAWSSESLDMRFFFLPAYFSFFFLSFSLIPVLSHVGVDGIRGVGVVILDRKFRNR